MNLWLVKRLWYGFLICFNFLFKLKFSFFLKDKIEIDNSGLAKSKVPIILKAVKRN
jgi:hypothetical protein